MDTEALLKDISPDSPCGEDLSYDPAYLELETLARGKPETQFGPGEDPDWSALLQRCEELVKRSKDLRAILYLALALLQKQGFPGLRDGLMLLRRTLTDHWDDLFPRLDPDDNNDPLERMNIIASLSPAASSMSDQDPMRFKMRVMAAPLCAPADRRLPRCSLRDLLIASGELTASPDESPAPPAGTLIDAAFDATPIDELQGMRATVAACLDHVTGIDEAVTGRVGAGAAPDLSGIEQVLKQALAQVDRQLGRRGYATADAPAGAAPTAGAAPAGGASTGPRAFTGTICSQDDVIRALDQISEYYEKVEPSSPVPLLVKRARRLVGLSFMDIVRDLNPDAISQIRVVSGEKEQD